MSPFLFASPDRRPSSSSARRVHLRRLYDILHLSIQRGDLLLAQSSFALLSRCDDVQWSAIWKFALIILAAADHDHDHDDGQPSASLGTPKHIEFLRLMMLRHPEEVRTSTFSTAPPSHHLFYWQRESLVRELVFSLAMAGRDRDALDELELCGSLSLTFFCIQNNKHRLL